MIGAAVFFQVFVLHYHYQIARRKLFLASENGVANALIEDVCPLVRPCYHHCFVHSHCRIARCKTLNQLVALHDRDVGKPLQVYLGQLGRCVVGYHFANGGGIPQYSRMLTLSQHLV